MKKNSKNKTKETNSKAERAEDLQKTDDQLWQTEGILRASNLLQKVKAWNTFKENLNRCPICEREFREGDLSTSYVVPMHTQCLARLRAKIIFQGLGTSNKDQASSETE